MELELRLLTPLGALKRGGAIRADTAAIANGVTTQAIGQIDHPSLSAVPSCGVRTRHSLANTAMILKTAAGRACCCVWVGVWREATTRQQQRDIRAIASATERTARPGPPG